MNADASADGAERTVPSVPVRFNGLFVRLDQAMAWLDGFMARWLPHEANPLSRSGAAANLALIVAVVTGVFLLIWYTPSTQGAYASLKAIQGLTLGGWMRALHRYSSDLAMLLILVHAGRTLIARKFVGPRWLAWVSGVVMLGIVWFIGWTGYWLVWDQPAQQIAISSMRLLDALPIFGEPLERLYLADRLVPSLLFFVVFFLHMLLPLGIAVGLALHLARVSRAKLLPGRRLTVAMVAGMAVASLLFPAPLDAAAEMAVKAEHFTVDAWYLAPLALGLRFQSAGLWVALFGTSAVSAALPWLLARRRPRAELSAVVEESRCHSCNQCSADCPFDAIRMVPRTDGKPFPSRAFVDPARCVGCAVCGGSCDSDGIGVPWFDTRREDARIEHEVKARLESGASRWVALVDAEADGGVEFFDREKWEARLAGFQVEPVPTASWVQPKFVERLARSGVKGVLVVRDTRTEAWSRDGGRWVADRLAQRREPRLRPDRGGPEGVHWRVVDFNPAAPSIVLQEAEAFRRTGESGVASKAPGRVARVVAAMVLGAVLAAGTLVPSRLQVANPAPLGPEFVFSFKVIGDWVAPEAASPAEDLSKPIHMRGRTTTKPKRAPVVVRLIIDGRAEERSFSAKGISSDGPAIGDWRLPLSPGRHEVVVEVLRGGDSEVLRWAGEVPAVERRISVLTYEPTTGFVAEWARALVDGE